MKIEVDMAAQQASTLAGLANTVAAHTPIAGQTKTAIEGLGFFRRDAPEPPILCMLEPSVVLVVQGAKRMWVGGEAYPFGPQNFLLTSLDVPADQEVTEACSERPCLAISLKLDMRMVAELIAEANLPGGRERPISSGVGIGTATPNLLDPFTRLLALLDEPEAIRVLAPLLKQEIYFRLLMSDQAARLRQIVAGDGQGHRIAKAVDWLKENFAEPLKVEELAERVQMSIPTFHHHFRRMAAMSPLQYQKWLRLNEARRLMLNEHLDVAGAAYKVGYDSPSQFSREYSRLFGAPPKRDIKGLRNQASTSEAV